MSEEYKAKSNIKGNWFITLNGETRDTHWIARKLNDLCTKLAILQDEYTCEECEKSLEDKETGVTAFCIGCWNKMVTKLRQKLAEAEKEHKNNLAVTQDMLKATLKGYDNRGIKIWKLKADLKQLRTTVAGINEAIYDDREITKWKVAEWLTKAVKGE